MLDSADVNKKMGICPIMTTRYMIPFQAEIPGQIQRPGQATIGVQPIDGIVYCQMEKCQFFRQDTGGCAIHLLGNLRTIADNSIPPKKTENSSFTEAMLSKVDEYLRLARSHFSHENEDNEAPSAPSPAPGQAAQVDKEKA